jgi:hypothetical protein
MSIGKMTMAVLYQDQIRNRTSIKIEPQLQYIRVVLILAPPLLELKAQRPTTCSL